MKSIKSLFIIILLAKSILPSIAQNVKAKDKANVTKPSSDTKLVIKNGKENENGDPSSIIDVSFNGKITHIANVAGKATFIDKSEFESMNIPTNALSACSSWWGGAGDYFYIIKSDKKIIIYQGWQDEAQEDEGYHWKKVKEITN